MGLLPRAGRVGASRIPERVLGPLWPLKVVLALGSTFFLVFRTIENFLGLHVAWEARIFAGEMSPPYQYRVLVPGLSQVLKWPLVQAGVPVNVAHLAAYVVLSLAIFLALYHLMEDFLRRFGPARHVVPGMLLLAVLVPLTTFPAFPELENFLQLAAFLLAIRWITEGRDAWLVPLVFLTTFNREQMVWTVPLLLCWHLARRTLWRPRTWVVAVAVGLAWALAYVLPILWFGVKDTPFTVAHHVGENTSAFRWLHNTGPIWFLVALPLFAAGVAGWRRLHPFLKVASLLTPVYTALFFFKGNLWELAKYDLAFVLLFPAILATLHGERGGAPEGAVREEAEGAPRPRSLRETLRDGLWPRGR